MAKLKVEAIVRKYKIQQLRLMCQKRKLPYTSLNKRQLAENLIAFKQGQPPPNKKIHSFEESRHVDRNLSPRQRAFCFAYATDLRGKKLKEWATQFGVDISTINKWLGWDQTRALIEKFQEEREARIHQIFEQYEEVALQELIRIVKSPKLNDLKRQAIRDFLGYAGRVDLNTRGHNININNNQQQLTHNEVHHMSDKEIEEELTEIEGMFDTIIDSDE